MSPLAVLVVSSNPLARMGLAALLAAIPALRVVGQSSGADLAILRDLTQPEVLVWEWSWDETPERLRAAQAYPVLALVEDAKQGAEAWRMGVRGLLRREADADTLTAALHALAAGLVALQPELAPALHTPDEQTELPALLEALTSRELEVLQLLAEGLANKAIARQLAITEHTVKFHVNAIMSKLGAQSRTEAVVRATRLGLIVL